MAASLIDDARLLQMFSELFATITAVPVRLMGMPEPDGSMVLRWQGMTLTRAVRRGREQAAATGSGVLTFVVVVKAEQTLANLWSIGTAAAALAGVVDAKTLVETTDLGAAVVNGHKVIWGAMQTVYEDEAMEDLSTRVATVTLPFDVARADAETLMDVIP